MNWTGGQAVIQTLVQLGARRAFGVPGESYLAALDAMHEQREHFDFVIARQEGGAGFMAEAYGKLTGTPGICFVTRGPGATNAAIAVHSAMQASTPMLLFVGQVGLDHQELEAFQELDYRQVFGPIAKAAIEIPSAARAAEFTAKAWHLALNGRPGPVVVALPEDILRDSTPQNPVRDVPVPAPPAPNPDWVAALGAAMSQAQKPVVLLGGAGWDRTGQEAIQGFCEAQNIPAMAAFRFHDIFDNHNPAYMGEAGVGMLPHIRATLQNADLIIALNVRFGEMTTDAFQLFGDDRADQQIFHCHQSGDELNKVIRADHSTIAGPNVVAQVLQSLPKTPRDPAWMARCRAEYEAAQIAPAQPGGVDMAQVTQIIQSHLTPDAIVTNGAGNFAIWPNKFLRYGTGNRLLAPQSGAMGYGVPAAIAAKIEHPDRQVICFAGDGDFQMNLNELGTALQRDARPIILILNNGTYGTIRMHQEMHYPARVSGTDLMNPDFCALARAYGFWATRIDKSDDFESAWETARASDTGAVIELMIDPEALTPHKTLSQIRSGA